MEQQNYSAVDVSTLSANTLASINSRLFCLPDGLNKFSNDDLCPYVKSRLQNRQKLFALGLLGFLSRPFFGGLVVWDM